MTEMQRIEQRLRRALAAVADQSPAAAPPGSGREGEDLFAPAAAHRRSRPLVGAVTVVVVIAAVALGLAYGPRSSTNHPGRSPAGQTNSGPDTIALGPTISDLGQLVASAGKLWVTGVAADGGGATLEEFDAGTGQVLHTTALPDGLPYQMAAGPDSIWLRSSVGESSTHLVKIDATTGKVLLDVVVQKDGGLAVTASDVWVVNGSLGLLRIDPQTGRTLATIALPGGIYPPLALTSGPLGLYLGSNYDGSVLRVDDGSDTVSLVTHVGHEVDQIVELGGSLWVSTGHAIVELPVSTGVPGRTVDLAATVLRLASDGHQLWVTTDKGQPGVDRIDPVSGQVTPAALPAGVTGLLAVASDPGTGVSWAAASSPALSLVRLVACPSGSTSGSSTPETVPGGAVCPAAIVTVPDVVGMASSTATAELSTLGLSVMVVDVPSPTVPAGTVLATLPDAGAVVPPGSLVTLTESIGPGG